MATNDTDTASREQRSAAKGVSTIGTPALRVMTDQIVKERRELTSSRVQTLTAPFLFLRSMYAFIIIINNVSGSNA